MALKYYNIKEQPPMQINYKIVLALAIALCCTIISIGFFVNRQAQINRAADIKQAQIQEENEVIRTKERWGTLPWNRKDK